MKNDAEKLSMGLVEAASCWQDPETSSIEFDARLARAFAKRFDLYEEKLKKLRTAIRFHHDTWAQVNNDELCLGECRRVCAALDAVEKLEKDK